MISSHFFRSQAKEELVVAFTFSFAAWLSITRPLQGEALQPFCGAEISTSTPTACMSTQTVPEAMQSSTKRPPTACTARSEEHTSELQSLMRLSYAVVCLKKKTTTL